MPPPGLSAVTGAFSYTGRYIAQRLLDAGHRVKTLTGHPRSPDPFAGRVDVAPLDFGDPGGLARSLEGTDTLFNTYWIRLSHGRVTFESAVENTRVLIRAAEEAGVGKLVHVSITNADPDSRLPYFRGKGLAEQAVSGSRLSWAIVRPTLIFGREDILINNIAWGLRRFPFFPMFGSGAYRVQPVYVEDVARIAVGAGFESGDRVIDATGPETYTFEELVRLVRASVGGRARLVHLSPGPAHALTRLAGILTHDVVLTRDEIDGLMAGLLVSDAPATGTTLLSEWLAENGDRLGRSYRSELKRHY